MSGPDDHDDHTSEQPTTRRDEAAVQRVASFLRGRGITEVAINDAVALGRLHLLVADAVVIPDLGRYTSSELATRAGMEGELAARLWRAMGFPDPRADDAAFTDADLDALRTTKLMLDLGLMEESTAIQMTRVIGTSMSRIAEAELGASIFSSSDLPDEQWADILSTTIEATLPAVAGLLEYAWRRHLQAAVRRFALAGPVHIGEDGEAAPGVRELAVGFADLVGFTAQSQQLSESSLAALVRRFEDLAYEAVVGHGGRVIKMIGDEVMYAVDDPGAAVLIGLSLSEAYAHDDLLSDVRVGLAFGHVLARDGDVFGPVVNAAHRIVNVARPGTVVCHGSILEPLDDDPRFLWRSLQRRYLKDIGRVDLYTVRRNEDDAEQFVDQARRIGERQLRRFLPEAILERERERSRLRIRRHGDDGS